MPNWLERAMARAPTETQPGVSVRDGVTRGRDFFWRPGDGWLRNTGRIARAAAIGLTTGPMGVLGAAARNAAQGEAREGLSHVARRAWERFGSNEQEAPAPSQTPSRGRTWPTNMGPPAPEVVDPNAWGPEESRANNPRQDPNAFGPPRPPAPRAARGVGSRGGEAVGGTQAEQRAAGRAFVESYRDPGMNQRSLALAARLAMDRMYQGEEK